MYQPKVKVQADANSQTLRMERNHDPVSLASLIAEAGYTVLSATSI